MMPEYTAIHEAANAIVELLRREMTPEPISKPELIGLCPPYEPEDYQLTVSLYNFEEDGHRPTPNYGYTQEGRSVQRINPMPLQLHLIVTAHSKAPVQTRAADEYRIIGRAVQVIKDNPVLSGDALTGSLKDSPEPLRLMIEKGLTIEQLMRIWGSSSKPYKLSFGCQIGPVLIDSERTRSVARVGQIAITMEDTSK